MGASPKVQGGGKLEDVKIIMKIQTVKDIVQSE